MTKEEAIKMAKAALECMEREVSGCDEMCNSHKCDECALNYERGNMGEQLELLRLVIKALEQELILDKIRAEIEALPKTYPFADHMYTYIKTSDCLQIIDRYKAESEDKE